MTKLTTQTLIKMLLLHDPDYEIDDLLRILELNEYRASRFLVSCIRSEFRRDLKLLEQYGKMNSDTQYTLPPSISLERMTRSKKKTHRRYRDQFYYQ